VGQRWGARKRTMACFRMASAIILAFVLVGVVATESEMQDAVIPEVEIDVPEQAAGDATTSQLLSQIQKQRDEQARMARRQELFKERVAKKQSSRMAKAKLRAQAEMKRQEDQFLVEEKQMRQKEITEKGASMMQEAREKRTAQYNTMLTAVQDRLKSMTDSESVPEQYKQDSEQKAAPKNVNKKAGAAETATQESAAQTNWDMLLKQTQSKLEAQRQQGAEMKANMEKSQENFKEKERVRLKMKLIQAEAQAETHMRSAEIMEEIE